MTVFAKILLFIGFGMSIFNDFWGIAKWANSGVTNSGTSVMILNHLRYVFSTKINESKVILLPFL